MIWNQRFRIYAMKTMKWKMIRIELLVSIKSLRKECKLRRARWWACKVTSRTWWLTGSRWQAHKWARWKQGSTALTPGIWNMLLGLTKEAWWAECKEWVIKMRTSRIKTDSTVAVNRHSMTMEACTREYNNRKLAPTTVIKESWYLIMLLTSPGVSDPGKSWTSLTTLVWEEVCEEAWLGPWKDQWSAAEAETESVFSKSTLTRVKGQTSRSSTSPEMSLTHWIEILRTNNNPCSRWNDNKTSTI